MPCWKAVKPAQLVTDAYVINTATHAKRLLMSRNKKWLGSLASNSAATLKERKNKKDNKSHTHIKWFPAARDHK